MGPLAAQRGRSAQANSGAFWCRSSAPGSKERRALPWRGDGGRRVGGDPEDLCQGCAEASDGMSDYHPTGETALGIVPPADIRAYADHYRGLYMPEQIEKIEPHITVRVPFAPAHLLNEVEPRLRTVLAKCPPMYLSLRGFEMFADTGVLYLRLAHPERVQALYRAILSEF